MVMSTGAVDCEHEQIWLGARCQQSSICVKGIERCKASWQVLQCADGDQDEQLLGVVHKLSYCCFVKRTP